MFSLARTKEKAKNKNGMTLLEVLIVCAIVGILAMIAMPDINKTYNNAQESKAKSDMQVIAEAANKYRADMGPGALTKVNGDKWCDTLKGTDTNGEKQSVGPWLGSCPKPPHKDGAYTVVASTNGYTADVKYTYKDGSTDKTLLLSELK